VLNAIEFENITKIYAGPGGEVRALDDLTFSVEHGEFVVVHGPSGSGKSNLLLTAGCMIHPTEGRVLIHGTDVYAMTERERAGFRAENIGFVFQMFHLVPYLNIIDNVLLAVGTESKRARRTKALEFLKRFSLSDRSLHRPSELSTGERQRTAVARALLNEPTILLADEPTGNLDPDNSATVMGYLSEFHSNGGTVVVVTHERSAAEHADRVVNLERGRIESGA